MAEEEKEAIRNSCCFMGCLDGAFFMRWEMSIIWHFVLDSYHKLGAKHAVLIGLLIAYSIFGGWLFKEIEGVPDIALKQEIFENATYKYETFVNKTIELRAQILERLREIEFSQDNGGAKYVQRRDALLWYETELGVAEFNQEPELEETPWTWWGSIFYAGTLYTTIGYGSFGPSTVNGQIATIIYAIVGIPITVTILNDWGNLLFQLMCFLWNGGARLVRKLMAKVACLRKNCACCFPAVVDQPKAENGNNVEVDNIPLIVALFVMIFWICASAGFYCIWESWDYFTSFYFFFISFTTIGLGDVVPGRLDLAVATFVLVLMGLAVVAMALNVIQSKLESLFNDLVKSIENEFKAALEDPDRDMDAGEEGGLEALQKKQGLKQQFLYNLMGEHSKKILKEKWDKKAALRNRGTQTGVVHADSSIQTGAPGAWEYDPDEVIVNGPLTTFAYDTNKKMLFYNSD